MPRGNGRFELQRLKMVVPYDVLHHINQPGHGKHHKVLVLKKKELPKVVEKTNSAHHDFSILRAKVRFKILHKSKYGSMLDSLTSHSNPLPHIMK